MKTAYATIKGIEVMRAFTQRAGPQHFIMVILGEMRPEAEFFENVGL